MVTDGSTSVISKDNYSLVLSVINTNNIYVIPKYNLVFDYLCRNAFCSYNNESDYDIFESGFYYYSGGELTTDGGVVHFPAPFDAF